MKFIQLHSIVDNSLFYLNMQNVETIEWIDTSDGYTAIKMMNETVYYCKETTIEILQKIAEAEWRELEMISEEKRRRERSFMDEWKREVDEQLGRLAFRKDDTKG